jgi:hypothetical protein
MENLDSDTLKYLVIGFFVFYFVPWGIARARSHHKSGKIFLLNLLFGWSGIGWIALLIYSLMSDSSSRDASNNF